MVGLYGKLPAHGDFVQYEIEQSFIDQWDHWLQKALLASQEELQASWLDTYLVSPVWRFFLSDTIIDASCWCGILVPSVDKVGRYYPITVASPLPENTLGCDFMSRASNWFTETENILLEALERGYEVSDIVYKLSSPSHLSTISRMPNATADTKHQLVVHIDQPEMKLSGANALLSDHLLRTNLMPFSLWWCTGSESVSPVLLATDKLPRPVSFTAMLAGNWRDWLWQEFN